MLHSIHHDTLLDVNQAHTLNVIMSEPASVVYNLQQAGTLYSHAIVISIDEFQIYVKQGQVAFLQYWNVIMRMTATWATSLLSWCPRIVHITDQFNLIQSYCASLVFSQSC